MPRPLRALVVLLVALAGGISVSLLRPPQARAESSGTQVANHSYKVVDIGNLPTSEREKVLDQAAGGGWRLVTVGGPLAYFEK